MEKLLTFPSAVRRDPEIEAWFAADPNGLRGRVRPWFELMRACGPDVRELIHDGAPTACVGEAGFGYVDAFTAHANVGFFPGAWIEDPAGILEGSGKRMRHVKLPGGTPADPDALKALITAAYQEIRRRV